MQMGRRSLKEEMQLEWAEIPKFQIGADHGASREARGRDPVWGEGRGDDAM